MIKMKRYLVYVNMTQNGEIKKMDKVYCDVRGKNLDEETINKRLTNNIKTWQSAWNKCEINKYKFEIIKYEEIV